MKPANLSNMEIADLWRLRNSVNGNPRYRVTFTDGSIYDTSSDAAVAYEITNPEFRAPLHVWLTRAGRISYAVPMER